MAQDTRSSEFLTLTRRASEGAPLSALLPALAGVGHRGRSGGAPSRARRVSVGLVTKRQRRAGHVALSAAAAMAGFFRVGVIGQLARQCGQLALQVGRDSRRESAARLPT